MEFEKSMAVTIKGIQNVSREVSSAAEQVAASSNDLADGATNQAAREFDTLKSKKVPQSLEIGLFFCQIFIFII